VGREHGLFLLEALEEFAEAPFRKLITCEVIVCKVFVARRIVSTQPRLDVPQDLERQLRKRRNRTNGDTSNPHTVNLTLKWSMCKSPAGRHRGP
jgi:hypothetical protein